MKTISKAMIMAAGVGSRLDPLTRDVPKPLVPIVNRPVMDILLDKLSNIGVKSVVANTHYLADQIIDRYSKNPFGIDFHYIKEDNLSGTAGGLKKCQSFFDKGENFIVMSADGLSDADLKKGIEVHLKSGAIATIGVKKIDKSQVSHFGVVVTDENGFITEFQEKPLIELAKSNLINTGIYIFDYKIFDYIPENTFYDFAKNVFPKLLVEHAINTFEIDEYWSDIGTLEQYVKSTVDVLDGECDICSEVLCNKISESKLPMDITMGGYAVVGKNCRVGENVTMINVIIWDNVEVKSGLWLENVIIGNNTKIYTNVKDRIIGSNEIIQEDMIKK